MTLIGRLEHRVSTVSPQVVDLALAVVLGITALVTVFSEEIVPGMRPANGFAAVGAILASAPIAWRRRAPLLALFLSSVVIFVHIGFNYPEGSIPVGILVLLYSVTAWSTTKRAVIGLVVVVACLFLLVFMDTPGLDVPGAFSTACGFAIAWSMGLVLRSRRDKADAQLEAADERANLEAQRAATAVAEERLRIAQELHDIVAHSMSVIAVQAGMGSHLLDTQPERARGALDAISDTSRSTLAEMRRLLGVLRGSDGNRQNTPAPTLDDLPRLIEDVRAAGVPVTFEMESGLDDIDRGVGLSAYRVVQEALTNVIKHAGTPTSVRVCLRHLPGELAIEVSDDGRGLATAGPSVEPGHGLAGMRERVELWGGGLSAGPRPGGGYLVQATLPYESATP